MCMGMDFRTEMDTDMRRTCAWTHVSDAHTHDDRPVCMHAYAHVHMCTGMCIDMRRDLCTGMHTCMWTIFYIDKCETWTFCIKTCKRTDMCINLYTGMCTHKYNRYLSGVAQEVRPFDL